MTFNFLKHSTYTRFQVYKEVTGEDNPTFNIARTGYGRIKNDLFIFMNIGIPGVAGIDYKNHYDERTEAVSWCGKKGTHSGQPQMQEIINGELNLYLFARWDRDTQDWTYLGQAKYISFKDNVPVVDANDNETFCIEFQLTCADLEGDISNDEIKSGKLNYKNYKPKKKVKKTNKRNFKGRKPRNYVLKTIKDKQTGDIGERLVYQWEKEQLIKVKRNDLAKLVEHTSKEIGDGTGYDIKSFYPDGKTKFIEVKTTKLGKDTEFFMSPNEVEFSQKHRDQYVLYRLYELKIDPLNASFYDIKGDISDQFILDPTEYKLYPK